MKDVKELKITMEKEFKEAFDLLGKATNMKDVHKAYGLLFDCMQIYNYLKGAEDE